MVTKTITIKMMVIKTITITDGHHPLISLSLMLLLSIKIIGV